jgi:hypothetical protein
MRKKMMRKPNWHKTIGTVFFVLLMSQAFGQQHNLTLDRHVHDQYQQLFNSRDNSMHTAVKPYLLSELVAQPGVDSLDLFYKQPEGQYTVNQLNFVALLDAHAGVDLGTTKTSPLGFGGGLQASANIGSKISLQANYLYQNVSLPDYLKQRVDRWGVLPGFGYADPSSGGNRYSTQHASGQLSYSPNEIFNLQLGKGQHFWGDGYRSNLLSDYANNYPYLKISTNIWKIKYVNLFAQYQDLTVDAADQGAYRSKFMASHFLSWNATKKWNFTFFETVIWQNEDAGRARGFDVNYLNPVIFYRPIEYSQGSSDNSIIGAGWKFKGKKNFQIYGQILFDEFLLSALKADVQQFFHSKDTIADVGWWANKWAFQLGVKAWDAFTLEGLTLQSEINMVRPFTYSHSDGQQNYAHYNAPLAHPKGANFYEFVNIASYRKKNWVFEQMINYNIGGEDPGYEANYGGNIFLGYRDRVRIHGNWIGQGLQYRTLYTESSASYYLQKWGLRVKGGVAFRSSGSDWDSHNTTYFFIGIKTPFQNRYTDF